MNHKPTINLISAIAVDGSIGAQEKLLWKIPEDLQYYKAKTLDNVIVLGEVTYETLPEVALKGRTTIVVSEKYYKVEPFLHEDNVTVFFATNPLHALSMAKNIAIKKRCDVYIAGGQSIYEQLMEFCEFVFITWVDKTYNKADRHFPILDLIDDFNLVSESDWNVFNDLPYKFITYKNKNI